MSSWQTSPVYEGEVGVWVIFLPSDKIIYKTEYCGQCSKHLKILCVVMVIVQWLCARNLWESWVQKTKACPTFFPPTRHIVRHDSSPAQTTSYTKSKIMAVYIHLSSAPHCDQTAAGTHIMLFPPSLHILSSQEPHGNSCVS